MKRLVVTILMLSLMLVGCGSVRITHSDFMMDTVISYDVTHGSSDSLVAHCSEITSSAEATFSAYIESSAVSRFNDSGTLEIAQIDGLYDILNIAKEVYVSTNGAFDITVSPLVKLWGISHSDENWHPPSDTEISELLIFTI